jgi:hypothetical protein
MSKNNNKKLNNLSIIKLYTTWTKMPKAIREKKIYFF